jgi:hypothetical protein
MKDRTSSDSEGKRYSRGLYSKWHLSSQKEFKFHLFCRKEIRLLIDSQASKTIIYEKRIPHSVEGCSLIPLRNIQSSKLVLKQRRARGSSVLLSDQLELELCGSPLLLSY